MNKLTLTHTYTHTLTVTADTAGERAAAAAAEAAVKASKKAAKTALRRRQKEVLWRQRNPDAVAKQNIQLLLGRRGGTAHVRHTRG